MKVDISFFSEAGPRKENEDSLYVSSSGAAVTLAVADGLGGHGGGRIAADIAMEVVKNWPIDSELVELPIEAHQAVRREQEIGTYKSMATTLTALRLIGDGLEGVHVGDTRCAVKRGNGIRKLTTAHTEAQRLFDAGKLTKKEFLDYPRRNILDNALGAKENIDFNNFYFTIEPDDYVLLTTDGVHEKILLKEMFPLIYGSAEEVASRLKSRVVDLIPEDNFSCVVARFYL